MDGIKAESFKAKECKKCNILYELLEDVETLREHAEEMAEKVENKDQIHTDRDLWLERNRVFLKIRKILLYYIREAEGRNISG